jgi:hypothetical protein
MAAGTVAVIAAAQGGQTQQAAQAPAAPDPVQILVDRLNLDSYKATLKGLTQFRRSAREARSVTATPCAWIERSSRAMAVRPSA